jgi:hypothetical protein
MEIIMKDLESKPEAKPPVKPSTATTKQKFTLEELEALGLDPVPYGYPSEK